MNKRVIALLLVAVVLLAGCADIQGSDSSATESMETSFEQQRPNQPTQAKSNSEPFQPTSESLETSASIAPGRRPISDPFVVVEETDEYTVYQCTRYIGYLGAGFGANLPDTHETYTFLITLPSPVYIRSSVIYVDEKNRRDTCVRNG